MHYGVKGMKWGQHLFGKDYVIGGKTYSKKEVKADNKKAFEYGGKATITGRAKVIADRKKETLKNKMDHNPNNARLKNKYREASKVAAKLNKEYAADHNRAKDHVKSLKRKYGGENVKDLVYKKFGKRYVVNESIHSKPELATLAAFNALSAGLMATGALPISVFTFPTTKGAEGRAKYFDERYRVRHKNKPMPTADNMLLNQMHHHNMIDQMNQIQAMNDFNEQMRMFNEQNLTNQMHSMIW